jgi:hypothetical protein
VTGGDVGTIMEPDALDAELCFPVRPGDFARRSAAKLKCVKLGVSNEKFIS